MYCFCAADLKLLEQTNRQLGETRMELEDQKILREAYAISESRLDGVASSLLSTLDKSVTDLDGLYAKLSKHFVE
jgi:kinesin family protein 11